MEEHIPIRPDRSLLLGRQISKWSLWVGSSMKITLFDSPCHHPFGHVKVVNAYMCCVLCIFMIVFWEKDALYSRY